VGQGFGSSYEARLGVSLDDPDLIDTAQFSESNMSSSLQNEEYKSSIDGHVTN
jgi:hypothetical protein